VRVEPEIARFSCPQFSCLLSCCLLTLPMEDHEIIAAAGFEGAGARPAAMINEAPH
jgi:hypothetical protein